MTSPCSGSPSAGVRVGLDLQALEARVLLSGDVAALSIFSASPALFVENQGQWDDAVSYAFQGSGANVLFTDAGPVFQVFQQGDQEGTVAGLTFAASFLGANSVAPVGLEQADTVCNYYLADLALTDVLTYAVVGYEGLYDGIDLYTWGSRDSLKYEFHVAPGADPSQIVVSYEGVAGLSIGEAGELVVETALGTLTDDAPYVYQVVGGEQVEVAARFVLVDGTSYAIAVTGAYDPTLELVIDPDLVWSTFIPGAGSDMAYAVGVDSAGNAYVGGYTSSSDFPVTPGAHDTSRDFTDAFACKFDTDGALLWCTYYGGSGGESAWAAAADADGNLYLTGETSSNDLLVPGGADTTYNNATDAFVAVFDTDGVLQWATYLGGSSQDIGRAIAVDGDGNVVVTGATRSANFPVTGTAAHGTNDDAFITEYTSASAVAWSTCHGGTGADIGYGIGTDDTGAVYVCGWTWDPASFPLASAWQSTPGGSADGVLMRYTSAGALSWATLMGGSGSDFLYKIAVDGTGNSYVTGVTQSADFPVLNGLYMTITGGGQDAVVARFSTTGSAVWSTFLGGSDAGEYGYGIALDGSGNVCIVGDTSSTDFPTTGDAYMGNGGLSDAFLTMLNGDGTTLVYSTYLSGSGNDTAWGVAAGSGLIYVVGYTYSSDFPTPNGAYTTFSAGTDAFVMQFGCAGSLSGTKFEDLDGDGVLDAGEPGLAGWTIYLDANDNSSLDPGETFTTTAGDGTYSFTGLDAGTYIVREVLQTGWVQGLPGAGFYSVDVVAGADSGGNDFGNYQLGAIRGEQFMDPNGNGVNDLGEVGAPGWTIYLDANDNGVLDTGEMSVVTGLYGSYAFTSLTPGTYVVRQVLAEGWEQTAPAGGAYTVNLTSGTLAEDRDFGDWLRPAAKMDVGGASIFVYDTKGDLDITAKDFKLAFDKEGNLKSVKLVGEKSMEGLGVYVKVEDPSRKKPIQEFKDCRTGKEKGDLAFIGCDAKIEKVKVKSGIEGVMFDGMVFDDEQLPFDLDKDGKYGEKTAVYLPKGADVVDISGPMKGDAYVGDDIKLFKVYAGGFEDDLVIEGKAEKIMFGGHLDAGAEIKVKEKVKEIRTLGYEKYNDGEEFGIKAMDMMKIELGKKKLEPEDLPYKDGDFVVEKVDWEEW